MQELRNQSQKHADRIVRATLGSMPERTGVQSNFEFAGHEIIVLLLVSGKRRKEAAWISAAIRN
jgi:hypothetical protein